MTEREVEIKTFDDKLRSLILKLNSLDHRQDYKKISKLIARQAHQKSPNYNEFINVLSQLHMSDQEVVKSLALDKEIKQELNMLFTEYAEVNQEVTNSCITINDHDIREMMVTYNKYQYGKLATILENYITV